MSNDWILSLRDGEMHAVGPLRFQCEGPGEYGPEGRCWVDSEDGSFELSWMDGEAIAYCIAPSAGLWMAYESDKKLQPDGNHRGWLRLELTHEKSRLGPFSEWAGSAFQLSRLILDCIVGERAFMAGEGRGRDYRRSNLVKREGPAREATRAALIHICGLLARHLRPELPADWKHEAEARWAAADHAYRFAVEEA